MNGSQVSSVAGELAGMLARLAGLSASVVDDAARVDVLAGLERLRGAVAAAQVRVTEAFAVSQEAANRGLGFEARAARRGVPEQVGLARRVSPSTGSRQVGQAKALVRQLPRTLALLETGEISEWVAAVVVNATAVLSADDRRLADERLAPQLPGLGFGQAAAAAERVVIAIDQQAVVNKAAKARNDRRVGIRPAPDTMAVLSALLPCEDGVRAYAALRAHTDTLKAAGDERSRDQIMADLLVERLTGHSVTDGGPVEIGLIMTTDTLLHNHDDHNGDGDTDNSEGEDDPGESSEDDDDGDGDTDEGDSRDHDDTGGQGDDDDGADSGDEDERADSGDEGEDDPGESSAGDHGDDGGRDTGCRGEPAAELTGYGPIPASLARDIITRAATSTTNPDGADAEAVRVWVRRLFTDPTTDIITGIDPRRRRFTGTLARYLLYRDRHCTTPYCGAPIRHLDHITPHAAGGPTTPTNGRGTCERCNYAKQMPGWTTRLTDPHRHTIEITTPTGHTYRTHPPPAPGHPRTHPPPQAA